MLNDKIIKVENILERGLLGKTLNLKKVYHNRESPCIDNKIIFFLVCANWISGVTY